MKKRRMNDGKDRMPVEVDVGASISRGTTFGGWAATIKNGSETRIVSGAAQSTDYCRLCLLGTVAALESLPRNSSVTVYSSSRYVLAGVERLPAWKERDWRTATFRIIRNEDLWRRLDRSLQRHVITWR